MAGRIEDVLIGLEHELNDCIMRGDFAVLEQILASEYILIVPDMPPGRFDRASYIAVAKTVKADRYHYDDFLVRQYGDAAIVASHYEQAATYGGVERSGQFAISDFWIYRDGRWQLALRHSSRAAISGE
jgi:uncharacterized protein DUF4440